MGTLGTLGAEAFEALPLPKADAMSPAEAALPDKAFPDSVALADGTVAPGVTPRAFAIFLVPVVEASGGDVPRTGGGKILGAFAGGALFGAVPEARAGVADLAGADDDAVAASFCAGAALFVLIRAAVPEGATDAGAPVVA